MKIHHAIVAAVLILTGCQASQRGFDAGQVSRRLVSIEHARLASARGKRPAQRTLRLQDATDPLGSTLLTWDSGERQPDAAPWALASFDGTALFDQSDEQDQTDMSFWSEKEEKYLRRRPLASFWETVTRDLKYMPADVWRDTKRVYTKPLNLVILGTAYGGSLALQEAGPDDTVEHHFRRERPFGRYEIHRHFSSGWRDGFGAAGNPGTHFALAGLWYLAGQQSMDDKTYEVGKTLFSALAINGITVLLGQAATADRSPNGERGTFPSGHTSSTFVVASVLDEAYGPAVGIPLYLLGGLVAHERLEDGEHYLSDVVMGAVLGTVIGHSVAQGRDPEFFGWKIIPYASPQGGTGVALMKELP
jgi:hypothetical protein